MKSVYSVGQINSYIKNMFSQDFMLRSIYVKGEVSNVKYHSSGHIYFTMKDKTGMLACVMFAGFRKALGFTLKEGQQIISGGSIEVYERDGKYQFYVKEIILDGAGLLYEKYERLKKELEDMGMFAVEYKKPIPVYAQKIGIVTAPTGAAVQDIINIAKRRNPYIQLILYPALVQGEGAKESIVNGIRALESAGVDVIIVGRGGGSIEDLWAFNEEIVARAIFECNVPVVSAVGHETDTTIADYVADMRAPTPSAAAELTVFSFEEYTRRYIDLYSILRHHFIRQINDKKNRCEQMRFRLLALSPQSRIREKRMRCINERELMEKRIQQVLQSKKHALQLRIEKLKAMSPLDRLQSGYAYVENEQGGVVSDIEQVRIGQLLTLHVKNGLLHAQVKEKQSVRREFDGTEYRRNGRAFFRGGI